MNSKFTVKATLKSFGYAWNGLRILIFEESNARIHLLAVLLVNIAGFYFQLRAFEWVAIWFCIGMVFVTELLNTALENICNYISPEKNELIGKVKDLAAAAVMVAAFVSLVVAILIFGFRTDIVLKN